MPFSAVHDAFPAINIPLKLRYRDNSPGFQAALWTVGSQRYWQNATGGDWEDCNWDRKWERAGMHIRIRMARANLSGEFNKTFKVAAPLGEFAG
ncbi:MAG: hypothetical protein WBL74_14105 [Novosphingobium sp.]|uniref:hypothetical protein n=1 Tax=Novosphingobium sp. TaxID=1874826 RepID=UPI003C7E7191